jgi:hypothetical protein
MLTSDYCGSSRTTSQFSYLRYFILIYRDEALLPALKHTVLPLRGSFLSSGTEVPVDLIMMQLVLPAIGRLLRPKRGFKKTCQLLIRRWSRYWGLKSFLFGGRWLSDEGEFISVSLDDYPREVSVVPLPNVKNSIVLSSYSARDKNSTLSKGSLARVIAQDDFVKSPTVKRVFST